MQSFPPVDILGCMGNRDEDLSVFFFFVILYVLVNISALVIFKHARLFVCVFFSFLMDFKFFGRRCFASFIRALWFGWKFIGLLFGMLDFLLF